ncbi:MAG: hypothetical protein HYU34_01735 [Candidatus Omnitrophica bacterium]|nr:hypothetical protein [Candidatus Omnitrophota bacterium]
MKKIKLSTCFCRIPFEKLSELVHLRFIVGMETEEIMKQLPSREDRERLAAVALLDVDPANLEAAIETEDPMLAKHLFGCREKALKILKEHGIELRGSRRGADG